MGARRQPFFRNGVLLLAGLSLMGWAFVVWSATHMSAPLVQLMMPMRAMWSAEEIAVVWLMWAVMMGAMMLPSAAPMILVHRRVAVVRAQGGAAAANGWFTSAYLAVWVAFSAAATALQWGLQSMGVLSHMLVLREPWVSGVILIVAGVVQWTPWKQACLMRCRTPIGFVITEWREGRGGALVMGARHGAFCVGCCWSLMVLLFVFGAMSLTAIVVLSTVVAVEKLAPHGQRLGQAGGGLLVAWGLWLLIAG